MLKSVVILNFVFGNAFNLIPHPLDGKIAYINGLTKKDIVSLGKSEVLELKYEFSKHPLLVFQDIKDLETKEFVNFVKLFDDYADEEAIKYPGEYPNQMLQPFDQLPDCKHVAPRGNMFLEDYEGLKNLQIEPFTPFKENYVWHTDMLGHDYKMTNLVTGFYTKKSPLIGGETDFISGETIYKSLNNDEKEACKNILVEINRQKFVTETSKQNYAGTERTEEFEEGSGTYTVPIAYSKEGPNEEDRILMMPTFIEKIAGWSVKDTREWVKMFMNKHVLPHRVSIQWRENDLAVFNNRRFIHSSTPAERYLKNDNDNERFLLQTFIPTKKPLFALKPSAKNVYAGYNNEPKWLTDPETAVKSSHLAIKYAKDKEEEHSELISYNDIYCLQKFKERS